MTPDFVITFLNELKDADHHHITPDMFEVDPDQALQPRPLEDIIANPELFDADEVDEAEQLVDDDSVAQELMSNPDDDDGDDDNNDDAAPIQGVQPHPGVQSTLPPTLIPQEPGVTKEPTTDALIRDLPSEELIVAPNNPTVQTMPTRSARAHRPNPRYNSTEFILTTYIDSSATINVFHVSVGAAMKKDPVATIEAIQKEIRQLLDDDVMLPLQPYTRTIDTPIGSFIFLKWKLDANGKLIGVKGRLVAMGNQQNEFEFDFDETSSPTANLSFIFAIAAIAAKEGRIVVTVDVSGAFLKASMEKYDVHMFLDKQVSKILCDMDPRTNNS
jgi:hypothetical protein